MSAEDAHKLQSRKSILCAVHETCMSIHALARGYACV